MPTTRPRHLVTESDELAAALDSAHRRWPGLSRSRLVVRLALEGERLHREQAAEESARRRRIIESATDEFAGIGSVDALRAARDEEWPA